jgi:hypothetical protein
VFLLKKSANTNGWSRQWFVLNEKTGKVSCIQYINRACINLKNSYCFCIKMSCFVLQSIGFVAWLHQK